MRYSYSISHVAGKNLCTADTLSRAPLFNPDCQAQQLQQDVQANINLIVKHFPATDAKIKEIVVTQDNDVACQKIKFFRSVRMAKKVKVGLHATALCYSEK